MCFKYQSVSVDKYVFNRDGTVTNDKIRNESYYYSGKFNNAVLK